MKRRDRDALRKTRSGKPARVVTVDQLQTRELEAMERNGDRFDAGRYLRRDMRAKE